jgi:putative DNA primase/helicase
MLGDSPSGGQGRAAHQPLPITDHVAYVVRHILAGHDVDGELDQLPADWQTLARDLLAQPVNERSSAFGAALLARMPESEAHEIFTAFARMDLDGPVPLVGATNRTDTLTITDGNEIGDTPNARDTALAQFLRTDTGNAQRLVARYGGEIRHCHPWRKWLVWDGRRWATDVTAAIRRLAHATARKMFAEAATIEDDDMRKAHVAWALQCANRKRLDAMLIEAAALSGIPILPAEMDRDPWLLNVQNGTIDLHTGELRAHRREDLITKLAPVAYDPDAPCPQWLKFLDRIFDGNAALIGFVQRLCGVSLTGDVSEQMLPIFWGVGANGKTTLLTTLLGILGDDYAMPAPPGLLLLRRGEHHPTERALLFGKRLIVDMESAEGARLNENLVKQLTGSDQITARRMREDFWSFKPTHKIIMGTNHKPEIRETKHAVWRRVKLVPFTVVIPEQDQILDLPQRLRAEDPGILAWCVRGCLSSQRDGLGVPEEVTAATRDYRITQDILTAFLNEETTYTSETSLNPQFQAKATLLYQRYRAWAERLGETLLSQRTFGEAMVERGFERFTNDGTWYRGLGLRSNDESHYTERD